MASVPNMRLGAATPAGEGSAPSESEKGDLFARILSLTPLAGGSPDAPIGAEKPAFDSPTSADGDDGANNGEDALPIDLALPGAAAEILPLVAAQAAAPVVAKTVTTPAPVAGGAGGPDGTIPGAAVVAATPAAAPTGDLAGTAPEGLQKPARGRPFLDPAFGGASAPSALPATRGTAIAAVAKAWANEQKNTPAADLPVPSKAEPKAAPAAPGKSAKPQVPVTPDGIAGSAAAAVAAPAASPATPARRAAATTPLVQSATDTAAPVTATPIPAAAPIHPTVAGQPADSTAMLDVAPPAEMLAPTVERELDLIADGEWLDQLARDIARSGDGEAPMRFRLHPQTLGHLRVELTQGDQGTSVRFTTETEAARAMLAEAQPRLAAEARAHGVRIAETHVDLAGSGSDASRDPRRHDETRSETFVRTAREAAEESGAETETTLRRTDRFA